MPQSPRVQRFTGAERVIHWASAVLVLTLLATGMAIYFSALTKLVGRREVVKEIHVWSGYLMPIPVVAGLAVRSSGLRQDFRRLARWLPDDAKWLVFKRRRPGYKIGKFNSGQKLLGSLFGVGLILAFVTGLMLKFPSSFDDDIRTGATFVHDWVFFAIMLLIAGHIFKALVDPDAIKAMTEGSVSAESAAQRWPLWRPETISDSDGSDSQEATSGESSEDSEPALT